MFSWSSGSWHNAVRGPYIFLCARKLGSPLETLPNGEKLIILHILLGAQSVSCSTERQCQHPNNSSYRSVFSLVLSGFPFLAQERWAPAVPLCSRALDRCQHLEGAGDGQWWMDSLSNVENSVLEGMLKAFDDYKM